MASRTNSVALLAGRPLWAATMVWKLESVPPGIVVWTCSTLSSARRIVSASMARSRTASELVPAGGATVTWTVFSPPALMNVVGSWVMSEPVTRNRTMAAPTTPSLVQRLRSAPLIAGV